MLKMGQLIRADKYISSQNLGSRKDVGKLIRAGRVTVDGQVITRPDFKLDPQNIRLCLDGKAVEYEKYVYIMMNKPEGVLSASRDRGARTVIDLVPPALMRRELFPAGRLDKDTTGLLILTNDGDMAHRMLSPKSEIYKQYEAQVDKPLTEADKQAFEKGIVSGENNFLPAKLWWQGENSSVARVLVCEGKFHQVKRMFSAVGKNVISLKRLSIGGLTLDPNLEKGQCRPLTFQELELVFRQNE